MCSVPRLARALALTLCVGGVLACQVPPPTERGSAKTEADAETPASESTVDPPVTLVQAPTGPPRVWVNVESEGLFALDVDGWRVVHGSRAPIRALEWIDGQLHLLSSFGVQRLDDAGTVEAVAPLDGPTYKQLGEPRALAGAGSGDQAQLWIVAPLGVAHFGAGAWTVTPWAELPDQPPVTDGTSLDVVLGADARPWLVAAGVAREREGRWVAAELPAFAGTPTQIAARPETRAIIINAGCHVDAAAGTKTCALLRPAATTPLQTIDATGCTDLSGLALSPSGAHAALVNSCGLSRISLPAGPEPAELRMVSLDAWSDAPPRSLAIDDRGRVWAGTHDGLIVIDADDQAHEFPLGQLGDVAGAVTALSVVGSGPALPEPGRARRGGLAGTVFSARTSAPVGGATLELCRHRIIPSSARDPVSGVEQPDPTRSPCAGAEIAATATTDEQGRFELPNLEIAHYFIAVESDGRWALGRPRAMTMRAGMTGNIGRITVP